MEERVQLSTPAAGREAEALAGGAPWVARARHRLIGVAAPWVVGAGGVSSSPGGKPLRKDRCRCAVGLVASGVVRPPAEVR